MQWKLFATLAEAAGESEVQVPVETEQPTLRDAFDSLLEHYPDLEAHVVDEDGSLHGHVQVLRNEHNPFNDGDGWETTVSEGDELALLPPVSGG